MQGGQGGRRRPGRGPYRKMQRVRSRGGQGGRGGWAEEAAERRELGPSRGRPRLAYEGQRCGGGLQLKRKLWEPSREAASQPGVPEED